jgi:acyl-CoA thioesterase
LKGTDYFAEELGLILVEVKDGCAKVQMKVEKKHTNALGFTHGGAIFSLADYAFAEAANSGEKVAMAIQVDIKFLKPSVEGDVLTAEAVRVSQGKTLNLFHVTVSNQNNAIAFFSGLAYNKQ